MVVTRNREGDIMPGEDDDSGITQKGCYMEY